jgi:methyltransferase-like protein
MSLFEQKIEKIKRKRSKCYNYHRILNTRDKLFYQNFDERIKNYYDEIKDNLQLSRPVDILLDELQSEMANKDQPDDVKDLTTSIIEYNMTYSKSLMKVLPIDRMIYL